MADFKPDPVQKGIFLIALGNQMRHHGLTAGAALDGLSKAEMTGEMKARGIEGDIAEMFFDLDMTELIEAIDESI